jgi:hypothetical protein
MQDPPTDSRKVCALVNHDDPKGEYKNAKAYSFDQINRDIKVFQSPNGTKIADFKGIQRESYCELQYCYKDQLGVMTREAGYVLARPISGEGTFDVHDFLKKDRPKEWGKMCAQCSKKHGRPVYHKKGGELVSSCISKLSDISSLSKTNTRTRAMMTDN